MTSGIVSPITMRYEVATPKHLTATAPSMKTTKSGIAFLATLWNEEMVISVWWLCAMLAMLWEVIDEE